MGFFLREQLRKESNSNQNFSMCVTNCAKNYIPRSSQSTSFVVKSTMISKKNLQALLHNLSLVVKLSPRLSCTSRTFKWKQFFARGTFSLPVSGQ